METSFDNFSQNEIKNYINNILQKNEEDRSEYETNLIDTIGDRLIAKVLQRRFGTPDTTLIFQENILVLCQEGAGFTAGEADDLRRAIGKKKIDLMNSYEEKFVKQWDENVGWGGNLVWDKIKGFAAYGFNKSHAVAYTILSELTAKLQMEFFQEFMEYNYNTMDNKHKGLVVNEIIANAGKDLKFPNTLNPFGGIKIGNIELKKFDFSNFSEDEVSTIMDALSTIDLQSKSAPYKLFLADFPGTVKVKLITRGVFDCISNDINGLLLLNKTLGKKATNGNAIYLEDCHKLKDFINLLTMGKFIASKSINIDGNECFAFGSTRTFNPDDPQNKIYRDVITVSESGKFEAQDEKRNLRFKKLVAEYGICNPSGLTNSPKDNIDMFNEFISDYINKKIEDIIQMNENNPNFTWNRNMFDFFVRKAPKIFSRVEKFQNDIDGVYTVFIKDKTVREKYCVLDLVFGDGSSIIFYSRDEKIIKSFNKNEVVDVQISVDYYFGKDGRIHPTKKINVY